MILGELEEYTNNTGNFLNNFINIFLYHKIINYNTTKCVRIIISL